MWRIVRVVLVFLLLGAVANVAVAWWCAARSEWHTTTATDFASLTSIEMLHVDTPPDSNRIDLVIKSSGTGISGLMLCELQEYARGVNSTAARQVPIERINFAGLPLRSFYCGGVPARGYWDAPLWLVVDRKAPRRIPFLPIWSAVLINTAIYGSVCWVLLGLPFDLRRTYRVYKSRCPVCAYPFGTSATCTECGRDLSQWIGEHKQSAT